MKGWHNDNYRHSLAARRISTVVKHRRAARDDYTWPSSNVVLVPRPIATRAQGIVLTDPYYEELSPSQILQLEFDMENVEKKRKSLAAVNDPYDNWRYPKDVFGKVSQSDIENEFGLPIEEIPKYEVEEYIDDLRTGKKQRKSLVERNIIKESFNEWIMKPKKNACNERLVGGIADCMPDDQFAEPGLSRGIMVEMEHTHDPDIAREISKDHIAETGVNDQGKLNSRYYEKLEEMENEL